MVLQVKNFRGMNVDISHAELGDILIVTMEHGNIHLMLTRNFNSLRWTYTKTSWLLTDARTVDTLIRKNSAITAIDGFGTAENGRTGLYIPLNFGLDCPLVCNAEISWESDSKGRERSRTLGTFNSTGGLVTEVIASNLSSITRNR